jgi:hypothetical protein
MNSMSHISTLEMLNELQRRLMVAQVASCQCMTKTPDPAYHRLTCRYARLARAGDSLDAVEALVEGLLI